MKTPKLLFSFFVVLFISTTVFAHSNYFGYARDRGMVISVSPDKNPLKSGDTVTFSGSIRVYNKSKDHKYSKNKYSLLEEFRKEGLDIVATFPSEAFDISSGLNLSSSSENEIRFSYTAQPINSADLNQFSIKVYNNHHEREVLKKLALTRAKLERRLQALYQIKSKSRKETWSEKARAYLDKQIQLLESISQKISAKLNSNEDLIAENTFAPQIDNLTSSSSRISSVMNKYRFVISSEIGTVIEGMKTKITASVTNLRSSSEHDDEDHDEDDKNKVAQFTFNNQALFTSAAQKLQGGESISYSYTTGSLLTNAANDFSVALYIAEKYKLNKRIGWVTQKIPVLNDATKPVWLAESSPNNSNGTLYVQALDYVNLKAFDEFGRIDKTTFVSNLIGTTTTGEEINEDLSQSFSALKLGDGWEYLFSKDLNPLQEGLYKLESSVKDLASNESSQNVIEFRIDRTPPKISLAVPLDALTNQMTFQVPISIEDLSPTTTKVYVNDELQLTTTVALFTATLNLTNEGANLVKVVSQDQAGNIFASDAKTIVRDTTPPVISNLIPANNSKIYSMQFPIGGSSNEPLKYVKINNTVLNQSLDMQSFTGDYVAELPGEVVLNFEFSDLVGNITYQSIKVTVVNKLLNPDLINVNLASDGQRLIITGLEYASRPGVLIKINAGILSFNRAETISNNSNGTFNLKMDIFTVANISATDLSTGETEQASLYFDKSKTKLSGIVKDSSNNPLPGATISISGSSNTYVTDGNGLFTINNPPTGDQTLVINGSTIPQAFTGPDRKFYSTKVSINVGIGQNNVLDRPIYLTPLLFDGSQTLVVENSPTTATSIHAPGVQLSIPANKAIFPEGGNSGAINIMKVASDFATIPPPSFAVPTNVYSFEPSGLEFKERVQLILPNENELPPKVELLIYSMNSSKGAWELDGLAAVSDNGQSVVTKDGHGISHFSLVYAVPLSPLLTEVKNPNLLGVDISQGSVTAAISLPSFKTLGASITPSLSYKSAWANPTAVTTNIIDIPEMKSEITGTFSNSKFEYKTYKKKYCWDQNDSNNNDNSSPPNIICEDRDAQFLLGLENTFSGTIKSWYEPEDIKGQFFISDITASTNFSSDIQLDYQKSEPALSSKVSTLQGKDIPRRSLASFGVELLNPDTGKYLQSGIYPTFTRYQIRLKNLTMMTGTNSTTVTADGYFYKVIRTVLENKIDSKIMENTVPKDVSGAVLVQSKTESSYGRGWNMNGVQRIVNTTGGRILLENEDGTLSTYALNNTISTLYNSNNTTIDLAAGVDLSRWPYAVLQQNSQESSSVIRLNLTSSSIVNLGNVQQDTGIISSDGLYQCTIPAGCTDQVINCNAGYTNQMILDAKYTPIEYRYRTKLVTSGMVQASDGRIVGLDSKSHSLYQIYQGGYYPLAGLKSPIYDFVKSNTGAFRLDMTTTQMNNFCKNTFGNDCSFVRNASELTTACGGHLDESSQAVAGTWQYCLNYEYYVPGGYCPPGTMLCGVEYYNCLNVGGKYGYNNYGLINLNNFTKPLGTFSGNIGVAGFSGQESQGGVSTNPTAIGLNNPKGITISPEGHFIVADSGNNRVRRFSLYDNTVTTIAGNGSINDMGDGGAATNAGVFHPKELVYDSVGNLYITTEAGYIRKVDLEGKISTYAGLPIDRGGILGDNAHAEEMALNNPSGMVIDKDNNYLYVADTGHHRVVRIDMATKNTSIVAGTGSCDVSGLTNNSPALAASLCSPTHLGLDNDKNLIVVDSGHGLIRRVIFNSGSAELIYLSSNKDSSKLIKNTDGTWVRTYRDGSKAYFNSKGNQTSFNDRVGRTINYEYNSEDLVTDIVNVTTGQKTELSYSNGKLWQLKDPANRVTTFDYSGNNLTKVNFPDGTSKKFEYNEKGMLLKETNERNVSVGYTYTATNRINTITHDDGTTVNLSDTASQTTNQTESPQDLKNSGFGPTKVADRVVDARGITTEFTKDFMGIVSQIKDAEGKITSIEKDIEGKIKRITNVDGTVIEMAYNEQTNDLLSTKNVTLNIAQSQAYNEYGQITSQTNANNQTTQKIYDSNTGLLTKEIFVNNSYVMYSYDSKGLLTSKSTSTGSTILTTTHEYDSVGNLVRVTDSGGKSVTYTYDAAGNKIQAINTSTGSDQLITNYAYDEFNRLKSVKTPKNETTQYEYLPTGDLKQITDPQGNITSFEYDLKGRLIKKTAADGAISQFAYDANGNRIQEVDPNGNTKSYAYDNMNKLKQANLPDDSIYYTYDLRGEVASLQNSVSSVVYQKDPKGRVTQIQTTGLNELSNFPAMVQDFSYDNIDNLLAMQSTYGSVYYSYDNVNRLTALSNDLGDNFAFNYDSANRLTQISRPSGYSTFSYTTSGLVSELSHYSGGGTLKSFANYEYDQRNFQTAKRTPAGNFSYQYDGNGQLSTSNNPYGKNEFFTYDPLGNRVTDDQGTFVYDSKQQKLQSDYQYNYFYDNNGNLIRKNPKDTNKPAYLYSYSSTNQLIKIEVVNGILGQVTKTIEYKYDVLGRRMQKRIVDNSNSVNSLVRRYIYNGSNIFAEFDGSNNLLARYTHSPLRPDDVLSVYITSSGSSTGLAQNSGKYYYLKDMLGSITDISDSSGNIVQKYEYSAYGTIYAIRDNTGNDVTNSPVVNTSFTYTGREWDAESGLYYYRARYYDANTGRFLQKDPDPGKLNNPATFLSKYAYAGNNPVMYSDPSGKIFFAAVIAFASIAASVGVQAAIAAVTATFLGSMFAGAIYGIASGDGSAGMRFAENVFNTSAAFLTINVGIGILKGGAIQAGAVGPFQGFVATEKTVIGRAGMALGTSSGWYGYATEYTLDLSIAGHEYGHTIQFFAQTAIVGRLGGDVNAVWATYLLFGAIGLYGGQHSWYEEMASELGPKTPQLQ